MVLLIHSLDTSNRRHGDAARSGLDRYFSTCLVLAWFLGSFQTAVIAKIMLQHRPLVRESIFQDVTMLGVHSNLLKLFLTVTILKNGFSPTYKPQSKQGCCLTPSGQHTLPAPWVLASLQNKWWINLVWLRETYGTWNLECCPDPFREASISFRPRALENWTKGIYVVPLIELLLLTISHPLISPSQ